MNSFGSSKCSWLWRAKLCWPGSSWTVLMHIHIAWAIWIRGSAGLEIELHSFCPKNWFFAIFGRNALFIILKCKNAVTEEGISEFALVTIFFSLALVYPRVPEWSHHYSWSSEWSQALLCTVYTWKNEAAMANPPSSHNRARNAWLGNSVNFSFQAGNIRYKT